jgi:ATP-dependent Lon protease
VTRRPPDDACAQVLGAHRAQIARVILPAANRREAEEDVAPEVRAQLQFVFVRTLEDALVAAFGEGKLVAAAPTMLEESRL